MAFPVLPLSGRTLAYIQSHETCKALRIEKRVSSQLYCGVYGAPKGGGDTF